MSRYLFCPVKKYERDDHVFISLYPPAREKTHQPMDAGFAPRGSREVVWNLYKSLVFRRVSCFLHCFKDFFFEPRFQLNWGNLPSGNLTARASIKSREFQWIAGLSSFQNFRTGELPLRSALLCVPIFLLQPCSETKMELQTLKLMSLFHLLHLLLYSKSFQVKNGGSLTACYLILRGHRAIIMTPTVSFAGSFADDGTHTPKVEHGFDVLIDCLIWNPWNPKGCDGNKITPWSRGMLVQYLSLEWLR